MWDVDVGIAQVSILNLRNSCMRSIADVIKLVNRAKKQMHRMKKEGNMKPLTSLSHTTKVGSSRCTMLVIYIPWLIGSCFRLFVGGGRGVSNDVLL